MTQYHMELLTEAAKKIADSCERVATAVELWQRDEAARIRINEIRIPPGPPDNAWDDPKNSDRVAVQRAAGGEL